MALDVLRGHINVDYRVPRDWKKLERYVERVEY